MLTVISKGDAKELLENEEAARYRIRRKLYFCTFTFRVEGTSLANALRATLTRSRNLRILVCFLECYD